MSDAYEMEYPEFRVTFAVDRLRRERQQLIGELSVKCGLSEAKTVNGYVSTGDFNFSSRAEVEALMGGNASGRVVR